MNARAFIALAFAMALSACAVGPDYRRPDVPLPGQFGEQAPGEGAAIGVPADWWRLYGDPMLDGLVADGLKQNMDIRIAVAAIEQSEALLREANASFLPQVNVNGAASRSKASTVAATPVFAGVPVIRRDFQLTASTSFELDFWGRLRRASEAARASLEATYFGRDVVALTLVSSIAQTYFTIRSLDAQIDVLNETLGTRRDSLDLTQKQQRGGIVSDLDVNQAAEALADAAAQLKEVERQRAVFVHQLGQLTGRLDLTLDRKNLRDLPTPALPPAGLPATLLERRPDVRQAEAQLASANAQIGVARAAQFPTISLTGSFGAQSRDLENLTKPGARIWSVGAGLVGPILDWGRYRARTQQAEAFQRQAAATYEKTAQTAFREVSDALSNVRQTMAAADDVNERVARARDALRLARLRYESGYSAFIEVLDAQRTLNDAELAAVRNRQTVLNFTVDLMRALGGGWSERGASLAGP